MRYMPWVVLLLYLVALDTFVPLVIARGRPYLWWVVLTALLFVACLASAWEEFRQSPGLHGKVRRRQLLLHHVVAFFLLGLTLFLYDPTLRPKLGRMGLGFVWILSLVFFFCWLFGSAWWRARGMDHE